MMVGNKLTIMINFPIKILTFFTVLLVAVNMEKDVKDSRVVVVGGGVAGLKAISELTNENFKNIVLLEAEPKLCGRIKSVYDSNGEHSIELGAEFVSGSGIFDATLLPSLAAEIQTVYKSDTGRLKEGEQILELFREAVKSENVYKKSTFGESPLPMDVLVTQL